MISIRRSTASDPAFSALVAELDADLRARYGAMQDQYDGFNRLPADTPVVIAEEDGRPLGCGSYKPFERQAGRTGEKAIELKRMFVTPAARRRGVARAIVAELETWARELGVAAVVLETGTLQHEAIALYERLGFTRIPAFPPYVDMPMSVCMRKPL